MNFFENELRKLFADSAIIDHPKFIGRCCFGDIGEDLRVRIEFKAPRIVDNYSAISATITNRTDGVVDRLVIDLKDILGMKKVPNNPNFPNGVRPYIWVYNDNAEWYAFRPTQEDYEKIRESISSYMEVFRPFDDRAHTVSLRDKLQSASMRVENTSQKTAKENSAEHFR